MDPKQELTEHYRWLRQYGLNDSHSGNASVRQDGEIWITPTGACADTLSATDLIRCPVDGKPAAGASLDTPLHQSVYRANKEACAVLHGHGAHTLALTLDGADFVPVDFEGQFYFGRVGVIDIAYQDMMEEAPARVGRALADARVVVVRGHGAYACAPTINLAYKWLCSLELSARIAFLARQADTLPSRGQ
jgi:L-fuculose-phosphate aldolase